MNPINGEPCNECEVCKKALSGSLTDITEIDAASNNGVDNIRDIREEVEYLPTTAKYRVYIIDEVHMLSTGAFNALLKTLEEPPAHVVFILATTEPQKLPVTILSRCQRFDFKRISLEDIEKTLKKCATKIGINIDDSAIKLIARMSDGAMRDAYSILDRCISDGDTNISESKVRELVGIPEFEYLKEFAELIIFANNEGLVKFMEKIISEGKNLEVFLLESIKFLRDILIFKTAGDLQGFNDSEKEVMNTLGKNIESTKLIFLISKLSNVQNEMKWSTDSEVAFETGVLKVVLDSAENNSIKINSVKDSNDKILRSDNISNAEEKTNSVGTSLKMGVLTKLKENSKMRMYAILTNSDIVEAEDGMIHIIFNSILDDASKQYLQQEDTKKAIKEAVIEVTKKDYKVKYVFVKG